MKFWKPVLIVALAVGTTWAAGLHQGRLSNRWGASENVDSARILLASLPANFGPWQLQDREKLPGEVTKILQCADYLAGTYIHKETGETVHVNLLLGPPGPMSVHRPEICFPAIDFPLESERQRVSLRPGHDEETAWMVNFRNEKNVAGGLVRVYYTWSDGGPWTASDQPRIAFGARPYLYKVQVVVPLPETAATDESDAGRNFLKDFVQEFEKAATQHNHKSSDLSNKSNVG